MGRHAYLIMAHGLIGQLSRLLKALDHERNDFYLHIDEKCVDSISSLESLSLKGNLYFTDRIKVNWGGASQIYAELILLKAAVENGPYDFYHLITGVDFPLMSQDEILDFYDKHKECLFISGRILTDSDARFLRRVKYYYPFQERFKRGSKMSDFLKKGALALQQLIGVNRLSSSIKYGIGSAYFDIPDGFANYVLSQEDWIRATFHDSFCADELFIQTVYFNSPYYSDGTCRYHAEAQNNEYIQQSYFDVKRAIDWRRGEPYVFQYSDRDMLINSNCFFARKFDERVDKDIIDFLSSYVMENNKSQLES